MDHQEKDETAVAYLATAMNTKLARARAKGRSGWGSPECTQQHLSNLLREHVEKGDPVDVANFCAFLAARGEGIAPRQCLAQIEEPEAPAIDADGARYRYLRDTPMSEWPTMLPNTIIYQQSARWDAAIDIAIQATAAATEYLQGSKP